MSWWWNGKSVRVKLGRLTGLHCMYCANDVFLDGPRPFLGCCAHCGNLEWGPEWACLQEMALRWYLLLRVRKILEIWGQNCCEFRTVSWRLQVFEASVLCHWNMGCVLESRQANGLNFFLLQPCSCKGKSALGAKDFSAPVSLLLCFCLEMFLSFQTLLEMVEASLTREVGIWSERGCIYPAGEALECHSSLQLRVLQCFSLALHLFLGTLLLVDLVSTGQSLCL